MHSAIVGLGCSPGLGFVHAGHAHAFVHEIADLYKAHVTIPAAFDAVATGKSSEAAAQHAVRNYARDHDLVANVVSDIYDLLWEPKQPLLDEQHVEEDGPPLNIGARQLHTRDVFPSWCHTTELSAPIRGDGRDCGCVERPTLRFGQLVDDGAYPQLAVLVVSDRGRTYTVGSSPSGPVIPMLEERERTL